MEKLHFLSVKERERVNMMPQWAPKGSIWSLKRFLLTVFFARQNKNKRALEHSGKVWVI